MKLYVLRRWPHEDAGEGEDWDEWFTSLRSARARRRELWDAARPGELRIERVIFSDLSKKALLVAVLNRTGYAKSFEEVEPRKTEPSSWKIGDDT